MRSFHKIPMLLLAAGSFLLMAQTKEDPQGRPAGEPTARPPVPQESAAGSTRSRLDMPVPKGQPQKGLKIPIFDPDGKLKMNFQIGIATWVDDDRIKMDGLRIETFKADGTTELDIDLPDSVFNTKTREVSSEKRVRISREDCQITGKKMVFDTETKVGKLSGGVQMLVYNRQLGDGLKPAGTSRSSTDPKPAGEKK